MKYYIYNNDKFQNLDSSSQRDSFALDKLSNEYICEVEIPGFAKEDIDISIKNEDLGEVITVKAKNNKRKGETYLWVPAAADASLAKASAENGLLTIAIPLKNNFQPKKLKVN